MKNPPLLFWFLIIAGCAQYSAKPDYVVTIPVKRVGNTYIAEYEGNVFPIVKVSDAFKFVRRGKKFGLEIDQFNKEGFDEFNTWKVLSEVYVVDSFGVLKEPKIEGFHFKNQYKIHTMKVGDTSYATSVGGGYGVNGSILYNIFHMDKRSEGWISASAFYVERLPRYYSFKHWGPTVIDSRKNFIYNFEKRARKSIQFYPER